jgi:hypothetical protein
MDENGKKNYQFKVCILTSGFPRYGGDSSASFLFLPSIIFPTLLVKNEWKNTSYNYSFSLKLGLA